MAKSPVIDSIKGKISRLIAENRRQRDESQKLSVQRDRLRNENRDLVAKVAALEKRISVLELQGGFAGDSNNKKLAKARINRLMREIDKCIALMNR